MQSGWWENAKSSKRKSEQIKERCKTETKHRWAHFQCQSCEDEEGFFERENTEEGTWISDEEEEEGDKIQMTNDRGGDSFAKALYDMVGDNMDDIVSSGSVLVEKENRWLGDSQVSFGCLLALF